MQIICISRGGYGFSNNLAEELAKKTGYPCISRSEILKQAADYGISVGKIEVEILKKRPITESLKMEADRYKAFVTAKLCEKLLEHGNLIYHGRAGHLVLSGLSRILSVKVIADSESGISQAMTEMNLERKKARRFIEDSREDIKRWVKNLYQKDWEDPFLYNLTINSSEISLQSAADMLKHASDLPEFRLGKDEEEIVKDLLLASKCHLELAENEKTKNIKIKVSAKKGHVSVNYMPGQSGAAVNIPLVLERMRDVKSYVCTVASTNIVCIGDSFNSDSEEFDNLIEIAEKWNAAVDLVRIAPENESVESGPEKSEKLASISAENGGILDESDSSTASSFNDDFGIKEAVNKLIRVGRAGITHKVGSGEKNVAEYVSGTGEYSLVVVGDVFAGKEAAQSRLKRDFINLLSDKFRVPVLGSEELKAEYLFGRKQLVSLIGFAFLSILLYLGVFKFQEPILSFVSAGQSGGSVTLKVIVSVVIALCIPVVAFTIGGFYSNLLKLIRLE